MSLRLLKKIVITLIGFSVLLAGLAMIVLPGPAIVVIPAGLAILAAEYEWAKRYLLKANDLRKKAIQKKQAPPS